MTHRLIPDSKHLPALACAGLIVFIFGHIIYLGLQGEITAPWYVTVPIVLTMLILVVCWWRINQIAQDLVSHLMDGDDV